MLDLTVASIPIYFGTMAAEHRHLRARAASEGPTPADYTPQDTATSLAMGLGSLVVPLVLPKVVRHVVPGRGRYGKALVGVAAAAAVGFVLRGPGWAYERHRQLATDGHGIVDDPEEATTAA